MGLILYNLSIFFYRIILFFIAPLNQKAQKLRRGKQSWSSDLQKLSAKRDKRVWIHCASLGEFEQGRPIIEKLKVKHPEVSIVMTFFSPSGYEVRNNYEHADCVSYLPWDSRGNARKFLDVVDPDLVIFIKYEFWLHFLEEAARRKIPALLVSGIFRENQIFFKWYGDTYRGILDCFEHLFVQNEISKDLLLSIGVTNVTISGDTRFDRVHTIVKKAEEITVVKEFKGQKQVFIAGSVWKEDLECIIPLINDPVADLKFIIAPHEINKDNINQWRSEIQVENILFSELGTGGGIGSNVLIIDNIGMLAQLYRYGDFAFIGGAFGPGLHNTLEAVTFGMPVFFGNKNYLKYQEANDLIESRIGHAVADSEDLRKIMSGYVSDPDLHSNIRMKAREYISSRTGATDIVMNHVLKILEDQWKD